MIPKFEQIKIPNETTLKSFGEDKSVMSEFHSVDELRKDLLETVFDKIDNGADIGVLKTIFEN